MTLFVVALISRLGSRDNKVNNYCKTAKINYEKTRDYCNAIIKLNKANNFIYGIIQNAEDDKKNLLNNLNIIEVNSNNAIKSCKIANDSCNEAIQIANNNKELKLSSDLNQIKTYGSIVVNSCYNVYNNCNNAIKIVNNDNFDITDSKTFSIDIFSNNQDFFTNIRLIGDEGNNAISYCNNAISYCNKLI
jgi:hypothetical protein